MIEEKFVDLYARNSGLRDKPVAERDVVRDLYDLHRLASLPFDADLLRRLVVLKLWQVRDEFDPGRFFNGVVKVVPAKARAKKCH